MESNSHMDNPTVLGGKTNIFGLAFFVIWTFGLIAVVHFVAPFPAIRRQALAMGLGIFLMVPDLLCGLSAAIWRNMAIRFGHSRRRRCLHPRLDLDALHFITSGIYLAGGTLDDTSKRLAGWPRLLVNLGDEGGISFIRLPQLSRAK